MRVLCAVLLLVIVSATFAVPALDYGIPFERSLRVKRQFGMGGWGWGGPWGGMGWDMMGGWGGGWGGPFGMGGWWRR